MKEKQSRAVLLLYYALLMFVIAGAGSARAGSLSVAYQCVFPLLEEQQLDIDVSTELPGFVAPGSVIEGTEVTGTATVNERTRNALRYIGATTMKGRVAAEARIAGPNLDLNVTLPLEITPQPIPEEQGAFQVTATGQLPALIFNEKQSGEVEITVNNIVATLIPLDHNDKATGMGRFESECVARPGQDRVLHRLVVGEGGGPAAPVIGFHGATLLSAAQAPLPLSGEMAFDDAIRAGDNPADLTFQRTGGTFQLTGFAGLIALDIEVRIEPVSPASISLSGNRLQADASTHIHVPAARLKLFGFTLARGGGDHCRTTVPAQWRLQTPSGESFDPNTGGRLTGTQDFPEVEDCAGMARLINGTLAGPDNPVALTLTRTDAAAP